MMSPNEGEGLSCISGLPLSINAGLPVFALIGFLKSGVRAIVDLGQKSVERVTLAGTGKGLVKDLLVLMRATDIGKIECKITECLSGLRTKESPALVRESAPHSCPESAALFPAYKPKLFSPLPELLKQLPNDFPAGQTDIN